MTTINYSARVILMQYQAIIGGPSQSFKSTPLERKELVCVPISTGVVIKGDIVEILGCDWKINSIYYLKTKLLVEVEKQDDPSFNATVPVSYLRKKRLGAVENAPGAPLYDDHALVYWAYSNLKNLLMNSLSGRSRVKDIKQDFAPCTDATIHAFGVTNGPVTFSIKEDDGPFSTSAWDHILGNEWDKVADGTAVITSLKFKVDKTSTLNFNSNINVHATLVSNVNFKTMGRNKL